MLLNSLLLYFRYSKLKEKAKQRNLKSSINYPTGSFSGTVQGSQISSEYYLRHDVIYIYKRTVHAEYKHAKK